MPASLRRGRAPREAATGPGRDTHAGMSPVEAHARRYLERYFTSRAHLRRLLLKRGEAAEVDRVLDVLAAEGRLNDALFAQSKATTLARRGNSRAGIRAKLAGKGVRGVDVEVDELAACCAYVRRRRLGAFGSVDTQKALARLCRAGFPMGLAKRVLAMSADEVREGEEGSLG